MGRDLIDVRAAAMELESKERPCYMLNDTEAAQVEDDQALEEELPGYLASFNQA